MPNRDRLLAIWAAALSNTVSIYSPWTMLLQLISPLSIGKIDRLKKTIIITIFSCICRSNRENQIPILFLQLLHRQTPVVSPASDFLTSQNKILGQVQQYNKEYLTKNVYGCRPGTRINCQILKSKNSDLSQSECQLSSQPQLCGPPP